MHGITELLLVEAYNTWDAVTDAADVQASSVWFLLRLQHTWLLLCAL